MGGEITPDVIDFQSIPKYVSGNKKMEELPNEDKYKLILNKFIRTE